MMRGHYGNNGLSRVGALTDKEVIERLDKIQSNQSPWLAISTGVLLIVTAWKVFGIHDKVFDLHERLLK